MAHTIRQVPYARHYNPRFVYFLPPFFSVVYNQEGLILQTIYVINKEILQKKNPRFINNQVWVTMA